MSSSAEDKPRALGWSARAIGLGVVLAIVCLRGLFGPGYVLQVDFAFGPVCPRPDWDFSAPLTALFSGLCHVVGGAAAGRVYAFGALFLSAFAPMLLLRRTRWYVQCAGGIVGALNPWVYDRMAEGQWGAVAAGAGLFLWLAAWLALQEKRRLVRILPVALAGFLVAAFSVNLLPALLILAVASLLSTRSWWTWPHLRISAAAAVLTGALLIYGVIPFFLSGGPRSYAEVASYNAADFQAFASVGIPPLGVIPALLGLYGYWGEGVGRFTVASGGAMWWPLSSALLVALAVIGAYRTRKLWLLAAGFLGVLVSATTASTVGLRVVTTAAAHFPLLGALRDPQKFDALWLLAVVVLAAEGIDATANRLRGGWLRTVAPTMAVTMILATMLPAGVTVIRLLPRSITPVIFPYAWQRVAAYMQTHVPPNDEILVLPWHQYQVLPFVGRLTLNPASEFFPGSLIMPNDIEIPGRVSDRPSPHGIGELALQPHPSGCQLAAAIRAGGISWIVIENARDGARNAMELERCGFAPIVGSTGEALLLHR